MNLYRCSTFRSSFSFFESNGTTPLDLSTVTGITLHILKKNSLVDTLTITLAATILLSKITITNAVGGVIMIEISDEESCLLVAGEYTWWLSLSYPDGSTIRKAAGILNIHNPNDF